MPYEVLARKWRPQQFSDVVGQVATLQALSNALRQQRLHHAYLFTGTRGVGKTTIARILAKCFNCEQGISAHPCGTCQSCEEIQQGRFVDLIEVDAASRTKVEDTRELLDNVQYSPTRGRYKVYLIDEVHMLSGHSFNALLKTLEEPPAHVVFLLATTDPQKLPITVLSRCLQFHLRHISIDTISQQLAHVLTQENVAFEPQALNTLASAAKGSMRDALSLLDQAIAYGNGQIQANAVSEMLGLLNQQDLIPLLQALVAKDGQQLLTLSQELAMSGMDLQLALGDLLHCFHRLSILQLVPEAATQEDEHLKPLAEQISPQDLQLFYQIGLMGQQEMPLAPDANTGFDMVLLRMLAFQPESGQAQAKAVTTTRATVATPSTTQQAPKTETNVPAVPPVDLSPTDWEQIQQQLHLQGLSQILASHCVLEKIDGTRVYLQVDPHQIALVNDKQKQILASSLSKHFGKDLTLTITPGQKGLATPAFLSQQRANAQQKAAEEAISKDPKVQSLMKELNATIEPGSVKY